MLKPAALFAVLLALAGCSSGPEVVAPVAGPNLTAPPGSSSGATGSSTVSSTILAVDGPVGVSQPRFAGSDVVALTGNTVSAYNSVTLKEVWVSDSCPNASWAGPFSSVGSNVIVAMCEGKYSGIEAATGEIHWRYVTHDTVNQTRVGGSTLALMTKSVLRVIDLETGELRWEKNIGEAGVSVDDSTVYAATKGGVHAYDVVTGSERWIAAQSAVDVFVGRGELFVRTIGIRRLVRLDSQDGHAIWMGDPDQDGLEHSSIIGVTERAVVVHKLGLIREFEGFDIHTGHLLWDGAGQKVPKGPDYDLATADRGVVVCSAGGEADALGDYFSGGMVPLSSSAEQSCAASGRLVASVDVGEERRLRISPIPPMPDHP